MDPETGELHIRDHDVEETEVQEILARPLEDRAGRDGSRVAIGKTDSGRYLKVIYVKVTRNDLFVITAYELGPKALQAFRRRQRGRS